MNTMISKPASQTPANYRVWSIVPCGFEQDHGTIDNIGAGSGGLESTETI